MLNQKNNEFRFITSEEDMLCIHFENATTEEATHFLSTTEIIQYIRERVPNEGLTVAKMGRVLAARKFVRLKRHGRYVCLKGEVKMKEGISIVKSEVPSSFSKRVRKVSKVSEFSVYLEIYAQLAVTAKYFTFVQ